jgi:hypothetical protein
VTRPLLSLVMIVKNEARTIREVLKAAKPHIDRWTILDTGSTDGTQDIINDALKESPGILFEEPFVDFATSRNRVMELDSITFHMDPGADAAAHFQLMLSGDEYLRDGAKLRDHLKQHVDSGIDCHFVRILIDETTLFSPRVLRTGSHWRYEGEIHEFPANRVDSSAPFATALGTIIEHIVLDPEKRLANIWDNHVPLLEAKLEENPDDERALIFLASSYESLFNGFTGGERITYAMKAMSLYLRRLAIATGNEAERNYCEMHYIDDARLTGVYTDGELLRRASELRLRDPERPETALLVATLAIKVCALAKVYELAVEAAAVAANAGNINNSSPVSTVCGWQAHHLAAVAAKQLARKYPKEYAHKVREHITAGIAAGGSWQTFKGLSTVNDPPADAAPVA